jgi:hypothetical protein
MDIEKQDRVEKLLKGLRRENQKFMDGFKEILTSFN